MQPVELLKLRITNGDKSVEAARAAVVEGRLDVFDMHIINAATSYLRAVYILLSGQDHEDRRPDIIQRDCVGRGVSFDVDLDDRALEAMQAIDTSLPKAPQARATVIRKLENTYRFGIVAKEMFRGKVG